MTWCAQPARATRARWAGCGPEPRARRAGDRGLPRPVLSKRPGQLARRRGAWRPRRSGDVVAESSRCRSSQLRYLLGALIGVTPVFTDDLGEHVPVVLRGCRGKTSVSALTPVSLRPPAVSERLGGSTGSEDGVRPGLPRGLVVVGLLAGFCRRGSARTARRHHRHRRSCRLGHRTIPGACLGMDRHHDPRPPRHRCGSCRSTSRSTSTTAPSPRSATRPWTLRAGL